MTNQELRDLIAELSRRHFDLPFAGEASFNQRFTRLGGRCVFKRGKGRIEISRRHYETHGESFLLGTILHELCHYHLFARGVRHDHRTPAFRALLARVGATTHCAPLGEPPRHYRRRYAYQCPTCGRVFQRVKPLIRASSCGHCDRRFNAAHSLIPVPPK